MAYKCSNCSFIDINSTELPQTCISCGAVGKMSHYDYTPKPNNDGKTTSTEPAANVGDQETPAEPGTMEDLFSFGQ